jgi:Carboxypeptidase regulatory-like domain
VIAVRTIAITTMVTLLAAAAAAQTSRGEIRGILSGARGPLAGVEVRVKNTETGELTIATTSSEGEYVAAVVPGPYEVFASPVGYAAYARRQLVVQAGSTTRANGELADNPNAGTPGEIPFLYQRADTKVPHGPAPRTAEGKPDLSGVWFPSPDLEPEITPFQPWAAAEAKKRASRPGDDPRALCLPTGVPRMHALDLAKFIQTPNLVVVLVELSVPGVRQIFLDANTHPPNLQPSWQGHSIGHWENDTLVVDTIGFNDKGWLDGSRPQTEQLHVIERFRRIDLGQMELEITIDDPGAYTRPWKIRRRLHLAPGEEIMEYVCNENNKTEHYVGR